MRILITLSTLYITLFNLLACNKVSGGNVSATTDTIAYAYKQAYAIQTDSKIRDTSLLFRARIYYPEFDTSKYLALSDSLNSFVRYTTFGGYATAQEAANAFVNDCINQTESQEGLSMLGWESMDSVNVIYNHSKVISLHRQHYSFTGGAHGNPSETFFSFNTQNGKRLKLEDIFDRTKMNELRRINTSYMKTLRNGAASDKTLEESGLFVTGDELPLPNSFALTPKGLLVAYDYYEIASFAEGVIKYTIPYTELVEIISNEYTFLTSN